MLRSRGGEDILTNVVSQKPISLHTNIHLQLKSKSISLCETGAPWWVHENKFCWWVALHGPIDWETERWWSFDLRLTILLYSSFIASVHGYFVEIVVQLGLLLSRKEESLINGCLRLRITMLFITLYSKKWKGHDIYIIN